jgi:hypothetical protein
MKWFKNYKTYFICVVKKNMNKKWIEMKQKLNCNLKCKQIIYKQTYYY